MSMRPKLTYANVVATIALFLAIGGGTVYAAGKLKKNSVKSVNIAKGAVKSSDLAPNSVNGAKIKDGTVGSADVQDGSLTGADFAAGVFAADLTGGATGGGQGISSVTLAPIPLTGTTTFTPGTNDVSALAAEAQFTVASTTAGQGCDPFVRVLVDGQPRLFVGSGTSLLTPQVKTDADADGPIGLLNPGVTHTITATIEGDIHCTAASKLDRLEVRIAQIR